MNITFDQAIEILEISDISKVQVDDIPQLERKMKRRWHPDKVAHLKDPAITEEYTVKFQQIETACQLVYSYLQGTYHAGEAFNRPSSRVKEEPVEIIRKTAPDIQTTLRGLWSLIKEKKYKWSVNEVVLNDGFKLKDLLDSDFKDDVSRLSVISFVYGIFIFGILMIIGGAIHPVLESIVGLIWLIQAISCLFGFAPLSRFWLNDRVNDVIIKFINFGLHIYNWADRETTYSGWLIGLIVHLPALFATIIKYILIWPLHEIAKLFVGGKVVGVVRKRVNYYADAAEWYVDELINKNPRDMTDEELFHLSYIYSELSDVPS